MPDERKVQVSARTIYHLKFCGWITLVFTLVCAMGGYFVATNIGDAAPLWRNKTVIVVYSNIFTVTWVVLAMPNKGAISPDAVIKSK